MSLDAAAQDRWASLRALHTKWALEYGAGIHAVMRAGHHEEAEECAFLAWAHLEAAKAPNPQVRFETLLAERHGRERPYLRLVSSRSPEPPAT